jgi:putative ABC transport system ATP-binding protein
MIKLQNISVVFNEGTKFEKKVLDNISLSIAAGKSVAIRGGNGAGKSTLVKVIAGEIKSTHGRVLINNKDYTKKSIVERSHIISRVFQDHMLGTALDMTVLENMLFASKRGMKRHFSLLNAKSQHEFFIERLSELKMGLEEKLDYQVKYLSGGQRQALSLVMAVLSPCKLLILDEHTSALDDKTAHIVMQMTMEVVRKHSVTTLMITHDPNEAAFCDQILEIREGKIYEEGSMNNDELTYRKITNNSI